MDERTINTAKRMLGDIRMVKSNLFKRIAEIDQNTQWAGSYKLELKEKARATARAELSVIGAEANSLLEVLEAVSESQNQFDYADERLHKAVDFIRINGSNLPEAAWKAMLTDYKKSPAVLTYLGTMLDRHGVVDGAVVASEMAKEQIISSSLPQRLSDAIYYACQADPEAEVSFSGIEAELSELPSEEGMGSASLKQKD